MSSNALTYLNVILTFAGITYLHVSKDKLDKAKFLWQLYNIIPSVVLVAGGIYFVVENNKDLEAFAEGITINVSAIILLVELACHIVYRDEIRDMVQKLVLNDYEHRMPLISMIVKNGVVGQKSAELVELMMETRAVVLQFIKVCVICLSLVFFPCGLLYDISPIVLGFMSPETHYREFPLKLKYPWNEQRTPIYHIEYVARIYLCTYMSSVYVGMDSLTGLLVSNITRQMRVIGFIMSNLDELASELSEPGCELWERNCEIMLAHCVRHYVDLKRCSHRLNVTLKPFLFTLSFGSAFCLCLCMYMIATAEVMMSLRNLTLIFFGLAGLAQMGLFCALGQHLTNESELLERCVAGSSWMHGRRHRSSVRIFQFALQRPITIYIFGSIDLSHTTFGTLLRSTMSYFTVLLSVTNK